MKDRVKRQVDSWFEDIPETKQLLELKEEICANLLERVGDSISGGTSEDEAFKRAIAELGDVSELVETIRNIANKRAGGEGRECVRFRPLDKRTVFGCVLGLAAGMFGIMVAGIVHLQTGDLSATAATLLPFVVASTALFVFFALSQETARWHSLTWH
ncbi:MAG: permease prefix domain 1-containing protein [Ignavibacteriales bacterium]